VVATSAQSAQAQRIVWRRYQQSGPSSNGKISIAPLVILVQENGRSGTHVLEIWKSQSHL
jgi:hypothetical protein